MTTHSATPDNLNQIMDFDHVITVHTDGSVTDDSVNLWAPEGIVTGPDYEPETGDGWEWLRGSSLGRGSKYQSAVFHPSEFIGGGLARDILETPGHYVVVAIESDDEICPACGECFEWCRGHGEIGDSVGAAILAAHNDDDHSQCVGHFESDLGDRGLVGWAIAYRPLDGQS